MDSLEALALLLLCDVPDVLGVPETSSEEACDEAEGAALAGAEPDEAGEAAQALRTAQKRTGKRIRRFNAMCAPSQPSYQTYKLFAWGMPWKRRDRQKFS